MEFFIIPGIILFFFILFGIRIIRPVERGVVERLGKYRRTMDQGIHWIIPIIDRMRKINITEIRLDIMRQNVITKDNLNLGIDAVVYFKVKDVTKALYNVNNYWTSIPSLAQTTLRSIVGEMEFTEVNANRQMINTKIEKELDSQTDAWGIEILRVELQDVQPAREVQNAMDKVVTAEREKEAKITRAIAEKESSKQVAEAVIIKAKGDATSVELAANAEANAIRAVNSAAEESFTPKAQQLKAWEVTQRTLTKNSKIIITEKGISPSLILNNADENIVPFESNKIK